MNLYSVRDINVGFNQPFCEKNDDVAQRGFAYAINNNDIMGFRPSDFDLYCVGSFSLDSGMVEPCIPRLIVHGNEVYGS